MKRFALLATITAFTWTASAASVSAQATAGTWTLYPAQATAYSTQVRPPIKSDGSSSWPARRGVLPVKFVLFTAPGPVVFESIYSDGTDETFPGTNDFSFLRFEPTPALTFNQITTLSTDYSYTLGDCGGGALRWQVRVDIGNDADPNNDGSVFIYYGDLPNLADCTTNNQSGVNMIGQPDLRYDLTQVGGTFYDSYANAQALVGNLPVLRASLVVDTGWFVGDDKLEIANVTVNDNTFVPLSGDPTRTCDRPPATIQVIKTAGAGAGPIANPESVQSTDDDTQFARIGCKYQYNLDLDSLGTVANRVGTYEVSAVIEGVPATPPAVFSLR